MFSQIFYRLLLTFIIQIADKRFESASTLFNGIITRFDGRCTPTRYFYGESELYTKFKTKNSVSWLIRFAWLGVHCHIALILLTGAAYATEGGASVYPAGVETIMPGKLLGPGQTMLFEFNNFYDANKLAGSDGLSLVPGFHLRAAAAAFKLAHNWGIHLLGGTLVNTAALPIVDLHLSAPFGHANKVGIANPDLETAVAYHSGSLYWWYGFEVFTPGFSYNKNDLVNVGQHNYSTAPSGAITYMPRDGRTEISSKFQYIVNYNNNATQYRSGNEFVSEYDAMWNVTKNLAIGGNGYFYKQTTNDLRNGAVFLDGNRARDLAFGPEIRYHFHHYSMILKYEKDFLAQNRPAGDALWLQLGFHLGGE